VTFERWCVGSSSQGTYELAIHLLNILLHRRPHTMIQILIQMDSTRWHGNISHTTYQVLKDASDASPKGFTVSEIYVMPIILLKLENQTDKTVRNISKQKTTRAW